MSDAENMIRNAMMQDQATTLLVDLAQRARAGESIQVSSLQSLANLRALADKQYLPAFNAASHEAAVRSAQVTGAYDHKMKNLDPEYLRSLLPAGFEIPSRQAGCGAPAALTLVFVLAFTISLVLQLFG